MHLALALLLVPFRVKGRREYRQRWSRKLLAILGVSVVVREQRIAPGTLLVANHVSWLDVIVLSMLCPADFVAKAEIRRWPLLGWLLARHDCLFVDRRAGRHLLRLNAEIGERLARGRVVAFFPEGTTSDGTGLLPFRPALFEPAVRGAHQLQAFALAYRDPSGQRSEAAAFVDQQSLWQSLLAIAAQPGIVVTLRASPMLAAAGLTRRQAACTARAAIRERLVGGAPVEASLLSGCALRPPLGEPTPARG